MAKVKDFWGVKKSELINLRDQGYEYALVSTRQGSNVWLNLEHPNPINSSSCLERGYSFWGMTNTDDERGWYFDYSDIEKILDYK